MFLGVLRNVRRVRGPQCLKKALTLVEFFEYHLVKVSHRTIGWQVFPQVDSTMKLKCRKNVIVYSVQNK